MSSSEPAQADQGGSFDAPLEAAPTTPRPPSPQGPRDGRPVSRGGWAGRPGPGGRRPDYGRPDYGRPDYGRPDYGRPDYGRPDYGRRPESVIDPAVALTGDEELVAGRRPVEEAFVARREARRLLVVPQRRMALEKLVLHAMNLRIPVVEVEGGTLTAVAGFDGHQGIALVVAPRRWAAPDDILALAAQRGEPPLVLVLDSLEDPQNVGTLLRTAEASGVHGAIFPTHRQAPLTPAAVKASAGAVEHLRLSPVDDLAGALADLHARGLRIVGADGDAPLTAREADLRGPVAIVVGSEGRGLGPAVRRRCDLLVRIPMHGHIQSLNAAVAGSILLYEASAQRRLAESPVAGGQPGVADADPPDADPPDADPADVDPGEITLAADAPADAAPDAATVRPEPARKARVPRARRADVAVDPARAPDDLEAELLPGGPPVEAPAAGSDGDAADLSGEV